MSCSQKQGRSPFPSGNPFRKMLPKGSDLPSRHLALLKEFEEKLADKLRKLMPKGEDDILSLPWMKLSLQLLSQTHDDMNSLITELKLPVCDRDDTWVCLYLDNSANLLDLCNAFISELSRLSQGQLLLQFGLHNLDPTGSINLVKARTSFHSWMQHIGSSNPRVENCSSIILELVKLLVLPKPLNSSKARVLMHALYGVQVQTLFVFGVFTAAFTGSPQTLIDLPVPKANLWAEAFVDLQTSVNQEIRELVSSERNFILKELEAVDSIVKGLCPMLDGAAEGDEALRKSATELQKRAERLSEGLDLLSREVDGFFRIVLSGRDCLLSELRKGIVLSCTMQESKAEPKMVKAIKWMRTSFL
ncbi:hypothetical protein Nepgr_033156 [Nepenthes gracilis]|uniref:Uncharacterized protein n=1 Tax=Nepenthes gracilis TaxID=150966 RepID=A0AAD3TLS8_NEPGR|nr:hypothetical protein Nepgr_033156 [Nepenthes gracilis]